MVKLNVFEACKIGDLETVQNNDAVQSSLVDNNGAGCLHYAARGGSLSVVEYLVRTASFSPLLRSNTGSTALHDAAARGNTAIVKWLVEECKVDADDQDGAGITALHLAARYCHPLTVEWLLDEACADESIRSGSGAIPLFFAVLGGDLNCVKMLMDENPRLVNMQLNNGATALYIACQNGRLDIAQYLHSRNGATKIKAYDGMSCLHAAAQLGHTELVKWLIQDGESNPNDRDFDGATPLHYAASRGHSEIVQWMLTLGGAKVTLDNLGGSPLHSAAEMGELESVHALLETGCDVTLVDNNGLTAAELADKCDQSEAAVLIRGEITLDQLQLADDSAEELVPQRPTHLHSPRLSFPPPPPFPPEEEQAQATSTSNSYTNTTPGVAAVSPYLDNSSSNSYPPPPPPPPPPPAATQTPSPDTPSSSPPPPALPAWQATPQRRAPSPPPPPLPLSPPPTAPYPERGDQAGKSVGGLVSTGRGAAVNSSGGESHPPVRRAPSRISVASSASDVGTFELTTVVADVHKSKGSVESLSAQQFAASKASSNNTGGTYTSANSVSIAANKTKELPTQQRKFSVLKYLSGDKGIQEKPELESNNNNSSSYNNNNSNNNNYNYISATSNSNKVSSADTSIRGRQSYSSLRQRTPSPPPFPTPPPLSPGSESFDDDDNVSISASTSCTNLDLPPPPSPLLQRSEIIKSASSPHGFAAPLNPRLSELSQTQSWSLSSEDLPPPPPPVAQPSLYSASSQDLPPPPVLAPTSVIISSSSKSNSEVSQHTGQQQRHKDNSAATASTTQFKEYFDSGTRANFARAKALFAASGEQGAEKLGREVSPRPANKDHKRSPRPFSYPSPSNINPDNGENEVPYLNHVAQNRGQGLGNSTKHSPSSQLLAPGPTMDSIDTQAKPTSNGTNNRPASPTLSTQSGLSTESAQSQDSVRSMLTSQGGHVTIISMGGSGATSRRASNGSSGNGTQPSTSPSSAGNSSSNTGTSPVAGDSSAHNITKGDSVTRAPVPVAVYAKKSVNHSQPASSRTQQEVTKTSSPATQVPAAPPPPPPPSSSSPANGVLMREGGAKPGPRTVVSAGPELLARPHGLNGQGQTSPSTSQPTSPAVAKNKNDLIADIQSAVSGASSLSLRRAKSRGEGVSMVYSSKRNSTGQDQSKVVDTSKPLTGQFDPKNFLDQVEKVDSSGRAVPEWRRHVLAKHAAEKAQKEWEEKREVEDYESRFKDMPAWKRALIERKEAQAREEEAASKK